ncbi:hypothetical protein GF345_02035 [Candidatus Woesearchaeota archaeon]|nr:hypothetical protein [Candidatus Woesearchaeota archaeon]
MQRARNKEAFILQRLIRAVSLQYLWIYMILIAVLLCTSALADVKGVEGYVKIPDGSMANNASVRVHVIASAGIGSTIPCTTKPEVLTDSTGYYITNLQNLYKVSDGSSCGNLWYQGDPVWAIVNGTTVIPISYLSTNSSQSSIPDNTGSTFRLSNTTLRNNPPELDSISLTNTTISGGNQTTVNPSGQTDENKDNISLVCCFDTSDSCVPTTANNECSGSWENITHPYSAPMNCTYTASTGVDDTYYARCRLWDNENYSSPVRTTSFIVDDLAPTTTDDYSFNDTWVNSDQTITITPDCGSTSCNWTYFCNTSDACAPSINYSSPITFSQENLSHLRYRSEDLFQRRQDIVSKIIKIDKGAPAIANASVTIENDSAYINSTTINFNWSGFEDNLSGINTYYYSFSNNQGTASGTSDAGSPGQLSGSQQGNISVFVWAEDIAGNIGRSVNDTIIVDSVAPSISDVVSNTVNQTSTLNITVNSTINDSVTGINITPLIEYRYGSTAWAGPFNMTKLSGDDSSANYTFNIPPPGTDWISYRGQPVYWNITVVDDLGNTREIQYNTTVISINLLTFFVRDRILNTSLDSVTITGNGTQCNGGCTFNGSINISELNGGYSFSITKSGFSSNTTNINVQSSDYLLEIYLDDTQAPSVNFINYSLSVFNTTFYAKVYATITDNLNLDSTRLNYTISEFFSETGYANFTNVGGDVYLARIGPYNQSIYMSPKIICNDSYGLKNTVNLDDVWYVFVNGTGASYESDDDTLALLQGWNMISVPLLDNHTVESVLSGLGNGNWGCGRDGTYPGCNASAGDFEGNFTKILAYNTSDSSWITYNPTDHYLSIGNQGIEEIRAKKGYWIYMNISKDMSLQLRFD